MQKSLLEISSNNSSSSVLNPLPQLDALFPLKMSLRYLKRISISSILLENDITNTNTGVIILLGDLISYFLQQILYKLAKFQANLNLIESGHLLIDISVIFIHSLSSNILLSDISIIRPILFDNIIDFIGEEKSKIAKKIKNLDQKPTSNDSFGSLETMGLIPTGFTLTTSKRNTKAKKLNLQF
jgi:hypothetical protein